MPAQIIAFPQTSKTAPKLIVHRSFDLVHSWDSKFFNPYLNSIYSETVPYVERWYLQTTHLLHAEDYGHPLLLILFSEKDTTLDKLITVTEQDLAIHHTLANKSPMYIAQPNITKLTRWLNKWKSLKSHRQLLYSS